jgi:hypothetical protein
MSRFRGLLRDVVLVVAAAVVTTVVAQTGVASAFNVPNNSVNSAKIVNGSIQGADIKDATIRSVDVANGSLSGADVQNGTIGSADIQDASVTADDIAATTIDSDNISSEAVRDWHLDPDLVTTWAKVDGGVAVVSILNGHGVSDVDRLSTGVYRVDFSDPVTACGWAATINDNDAGSAGGAGVRSITVERESSTDVDSLRVRTFNAAGPADTDEDDGFTLVLHCQR